MTNDQQPESSRPNLPSQYGILGSAEGQGLLPWTWATERLEQSRDYWLVTVRPNGSPHVVIVWGVWLRDRFLFATIINSRKAQNLETNPHCVACAEDTNEAISVEGVAEKIADPSLVGQFTIAYANKYHEEIDTGQFVVYSIRPLVAFASISNAADYPTTATRWRFASA